ncbi:hypothetical protein BG74_09305 [Sodalis-like endosymbiont of Proechinophthirus fluctus]|nr:hypothetical protein BG74_09305 [Sodalis-like endosymbiont of Proechinophthirus fluctus]
MLLLRGCQLWRITFSKIMRSLLTLNALYFLTAPTVRHEKTRIETVAPQPLAVRRPNRENKVDIVTGILREKENAFGVTGGLHVKIASLA